MEATLEQPDEQLEFNPPEWGQVAEKFKAAFPDLDLGTMEKQYTQQRSLHAARKRVEGGDWRDDVMYTALTSAPVVGSLMEKSEADKYKAARERFAAGEPQDNDYDIIAIHEQRHKDIAARGVGGHVLGGLAKINAMVGEAGMIPGAGRAAMVAKTPTMPSMWLGAAAERAAQQGGEWHDLKNLGPTMGMAAVQNLVMGGLGNIASGVENPVTRFAAKAFAGHGEMEGATVVAGALDEFLPDAYKTNTRYGTLGNLARGELGEFAAHSTVGVLTMAAMTALHGNPGKAKEITKTYADAIEANARKGMSVSKAAEKALAETTQTAKEAGDSSAEPPTRTEPRPEAAQPEAPSIERGPPDAGAEAVAKPPAEIAPSPERQLTETPEQAKPSYTGAERRQARVEVGEADQNGRHAILDAEGKEVGGITVAQRGDTLYISTATGEVGAGNWKGLLRSLGDKYPEATKLQWIRTTGPNAGKETTISLGKAARGSADAADAIREAFPEAFEKPAEAKPADPAAELRRKYLEGEEVDVGQAFEAFGLSEQQQKVMRARLDNVDQGAIGRKMGVSKQRIDQIEKAALKKMGVTQSVSELRAEQKAARAAEKIAQGELVEFDEADRPAVNKKAAAMQAKSNAAELELNKLTEELANAETPEQLRAIQERLIQADREAQGLPPATPEEIGRLLEIERPTRAEPIPAPILDTLKQYHAAGNRYLFEKTIEVLKEEFPERQVKQLLRSMGGWPKDKVPPPHDTGRGRNAQSAVGGFKHGVREAIREARRAEPSAAELESGRNPEADVGEFPPREYGMGAAAFGELLPDAARATRPDRTALANAKIDQERAAEGLNPILNSARMENAEAWDAAMARLEADPNAAKTLVESLDRKPRALDVVEQAMLLREKIRLDNEYRVLAKDLVNAPDGVSKVELERRIEELARDRTDLATAVRRTGTELGRSLQFRRQLAKEDFSLAGMLGEFREAYGREPTAEELAELAAKSKQIEDLQKRIEELEKEGKAKPGGPSDPGFEIDQIKKGFRRQIKDVKESRAPVAQKVFRLAGEAYNIPRSILASIDFPLLRQGMMASLSHPIRTAKGVPEMIRSFFSETVADRARYEIEHRDNAKLYQKSGLEITDSFGPLTAHEEGFLSRMVGKIPGVGHLTRASERAFQTTMNRIRADAFDALAQSLSGTKAPEIRKSLYGEKTLSLGEAKILANYVNVMTGRGNMGSAQPATAALSQVFFAPRWVLSRFQAIAGQPLYHGLGEGSWRARGLVAKEYARVAAGLGVAVGLAALAGGNLEQDPRSPDFGKMKFGNTRLDLTGSLGSTLTFLTRIFSGSKKSPTGKVSSIRAEGKFGEDTAADVVYRFVRGKLAPIPSSALDALSGSDVTGKPTTPGQAATRLVTPLFVKDVYEAMKDLGVPKGAAVSILGLLGMSMQTYDANRKRFNPASR